MWGKATAGFFPGFLLSAGLVGLVSWMLPGPWASTLVAGIIAIFPVWIGVASASFLFASGARAWAWLSLGAVVSLGLLWSLKHFGLVA